MSIAAQDGKYDIVKLLVDKYGAQIDSTVWWCALWNARKSNNFNIVSFLIDKDENLINMKDRDGNTALSDAASEGKIKFAQWLIGKGAKIDIAALMGAVE